MPLTGPSHTTMLTGLYPALHGAHENGMPIRADVVTVPELLSRAGYRTAAFVSGWTLKDAACGLASRFDHYDEDFSPSRLFPDAVLDIGLVRLAAQASKAAGHRVEQLERLGERSTARALAWLALHRQRHRQRHRERHGTPPFFAFVHYFDTHGPHEAPPPCDRMYDPDYVGDAKDVLYRTHSVEARQRLISNPRAVEHLTAMYNGEVSYVDDQIGRLLDGLATLGLAANTLVIFTADHGESLTEHGFYFDHGEFLYDTDVHVPLIVRFPDRRHAGTRQPAEVRLVDLAATILGVAGVRPAAATDGRSLLALLDGAEPAGERTSFGCIHYGQFDNARSRYYARAGGYKLIWNFDRREELSDRPAYEELYDLTADPAELHNLVGVAPPPLDALRTQMRAWAAEKRRPGAGPSEGVRERLRALGYL
jgi:arylsulfatase A-like enzyme